MSQVARTAPLRRVYLLGALVAVGCSAPTRDERIGHNSEAVTVCATGATVKGVDVSVFQGTVNWTQAKAAGLDFAIARVSDGSFLDTQFATNWSGMKAAGLVRGAYQFFEPGQDPTTQANIVISAVGVLGDGDLPVTADMEVTGSQSAATIAANLKTWMAAVQAGTGKVPMIYTAEGYWNASVASTAFSANPLWVANWQVMCPGLPNGWTAWELWQDADNGTVSGISGAVDTDQFNGTLAQLQAFAGGTVTAPAYGAQYVSQSWPLATTTMMMTTCQNIPANIVLKNIGAKSWDMNTRLATTQPRNRASVFADSSWVATDRPAQVTGTVAPGATFEFKFNFQAPPTAGTFDEFFGVVEDGVAWFSDPGQAGPPDTDIQVKIQVTGPMGTCTVDQGVPDGGSVPMDGGSPPSDGAAPMIDGGGTPDDGVPGDGGTPVVLDASLERDSGTSRPPAQTPDYSSGGCSCDVAARDRGWGGGIWALGLIGAIAARRRRR
jgi:lysozyme